MRPILFTLLLTFAVKYSYAQDQKFQDFQSARVAFEKHQDCQTAEKLMTPIYEDFKEDMSFVHLYAKVLKCLDKTEKALAVYKRFNTLAKDPEIEEEINELNYVVSKERIKKEEANAFADISGNWVVTKRSPPIIKVGDKIKVVKTGKSTFKIYLANNEYLGTVTLKEENNTDHATSSLEFYSGLGRRYEEDFYNGYGEETKDTSKLSLKEDYDIWAARDTHGLEINIFQIAVRHYRPKRGKETDTVLYNIFGGTNTDENLKFIPYGRSINLTKVE